MALMELVDGGDSTLRRLGPGRDYDQRQHARPHAHPH